jgi:magnesium chelatase subunit H
MIYIASRFFSSTLIPLRPPLSTPPTGCLHPDYAGYFESPKQYLAWYEKHGALRGTGAPVTAVLLYRKHVITSQPYIVQLIRQMEAEGVIPVPTFLNGVEVWPHSAHAVDVDHACTCTCTCICRCLPS